MEVKWIKKEQTSNIYIFGHLSLLDFSFFFLLTCFIKMLLARSAVFSFGLEIRYNVRKGHVVTFLRIPASDSEDTS